MEKQPQLEHKPERRVPIVSATRVLVVLALGLVAVELVAIQHVEEDTVWCGVRVVSEATI